MITEYDKETSPEFKKWLKGYTKFTNSHSGFYSADTANESSVVLNSVKLSSMPDNSSK